MDELGMLQSAGKRLLMLIALQAIGPFHAALSACAPAAACGTTLRVQDEFWVASTRELSGEFPVDPESPAIRWRRFRTDSGWTECSSAEFLRGSGDGINLFYVPGNRVANDEAERRGWRVYEIVSAASDEEPLRLVVWSWPSDKIRGQRLDFRVKGERTLPEGQYLGWVLRQFRADDRVSLVGYSFGARIITGAMHAAGGDPLGDVALPAANPPRMRTVLMAAAEPRDWLLPGELHHSAVQRIDEMLVLYNSIDPALKHYHLADPHSHARALGFRGFDSSALGDVAPRIQQRDVCREIGMVHDEYRYYGSLRVADELQRYLLWGPTRSPLEP